jgi:hypothetical protein
MNTWVLVIISLVNSQPVAIASVPGYTSQEACLAAGSEFKTMEIRGSSGVPTHQADYHCIPGPTR